MVCVMENKRLRETENCNKTKKMSSLLNCSVNKIKKFKTNKKEFRQHLFAVFLIVYLTSDYNEQTLSILDYLLLVYSLLLFICPHQH